MCTFTSKMEVDYIVVTTCMYLTHTHAFCLFFFTARAVRVPLYLLLASCHGTKT